MNLPPPHSADIKPFHALARFGLGRRGLQPLPGNPAQWLTDQLSAADPVLAQTDLPGTSAALAIIREQRETKPAPGEPHPANQLEKQERAAFLQNALQTDLPFRERLVWFWANHFNVSQRQGGTGALIGAYIRDAIRPHVTGRFADMLLAVMRHPAMLLYLDNAGSVGPGSRAGQRGKRGLNENLARECLELHTLSPAAGYTQADVTEFARVLTGWSVDFKADPPGYRFRVNAHDPGYKVLLNRIVPEGEEGGQRALLFLATHPATYRHLATKLARHFVADDPPPAAIAAVEKALAHTDGDLGAASRALLALPAAWVPGGKLRGPLDYVVASLRALDLPTGHAPDIAGSANLLGQQVWNAPFPIGWPDRGADWMGPEAMMRRIDWSYGVAARAGDADPVVLASATLGPLLHPDTLEQILHAGSRRDALTLLLSSPEFQRR